MLDHVAAGRALLDEIRSHPQVVVDDSDDGRRHHSDSGSPPTPDLLPGLIAAQPILDAASNFDAALDAAGYTDALKASFAVIKARLTFALVTDSPSPRFRMLRVERHLLDELEAMLSVHGDQHAPRGATQPTTQEPMLEPVRLAKKLSSGMTAEHEESIIAEYLRRNPKSTSAEIAEKTGIPEGTIRKRAAWIDRPDAKAKRIRKPRVSVPDRWLQPPQPGIIPADGDDPVDAAVNRERAELADKVENGDQKSRHILECEFLAEVDMTYKKAYREMTDEQQTNFLVTWARDGVD